MCTTENEPALHCDCVACISRFAEELRADRGKHDALRAEKSEMEARFEEEIGRTEQVGIPLALVLNSTPS